LVTSIAVEMQAENPHLPVIGVVGDVSEGSVRAAPRPTVFYSHGRMPWTTMTLFVRGRQPESVVKAITAALHKLDLTLVVSNVRTIESAFAESLARERLSAAISVSLGVSGLLLAGLGVYALLAYLVAERTKDIGIRIALAAPLPLSGARSSAAASRSSPSAPPSASPARCCSCGRSARCSSTSHRTTSRRTRASSRCWAPSRRSRPTCPRAAPPASTR
jgi:hypothetical protein